MNGAPPPDNSRGPVKSWQCDYEVGNISWAPHSGLNNDRSDWLGVSGGRGIWGVRMMFDDVPPEEHYRRA
jgi:WD repeat-containing protein 68